MPVLSPGLDVSPARQKVFEDKAALAPLQGAAALAATDLLKRLYCIRLHANEGVSGSAIRTMKVGGSIRHIGYITYRGRSGQRVENHERERDHPALSKGPERMETGAPLRVRTHSETRTSRLPDWVNRAISTMPAISSLSPPKTDMRRMSWHGSAGASRAGSAHPVSPF